MPEANQPVSPNLPSHYRHVKEGRIVPANAYLHRYYGELGLEPWPQGHGEPKRKSSRGSLPAVEDYEPGQSIHDHAGGGEDEDTDPASDPAPKTRSKPGPKPRARASATLD